MTRIFGFDGPDGVSRGAFLRTEVIAGFSTYLTMSYIFLLNPSLLAKVGIPPAAGFFATVASAFAATLAAGLWARLPYAIAPVPTITTLLAAYVIGKLGLSWQQALAAVFISGSLGVIATYLSIRQKLIESISDELKTSIMFAIGGFLIANGFVVAKAVAYKNGLVSLDVLASGRLSSHEAVILYAGFASAWFLGLRFLNFRAGPLAAIIIATVVAQTFGIKLPKPTYNVAEIFTATGRLDFSLVVSPRFWFAAITFFLVDFYGAIGKFVGLIEMTRVDSKRTEPERLGRALYIDSGGTTLGALLGTSSLAVFISSAVGMMAGGGTGLTSVFCAAFILLTFVLAPLVGSVPTVATAGILVYIGFNLMPWGRLLATASSRSTISSAIIAVVSALTSILTYSVDKALLVAFAGHVIMEFLTSKKRVSGADVYLLATVVLLGLSVALQFFLL